MASAVVGIAASALGDEPTRPDLLQGDNSAAAGLLRSKGSFAELWNRQSFIGPRVFTFDDASGASEFSLPGDFQTHRAIVLAGGWLAHEAPDVLRQITEPAGPRGLLVLLVASSDEQEATRRLLAERGLPPEAVRFLTVPADTGWVRDYGPIFVRNAAGATLAVDAAYDRPGRDRDDRASRAIADRFKAPTVATPLRWQGGNLLSNGRGLIVTTTQSINANIACGHDVATATGFLRRRCGATQLVVLEHLVGERTGHVDMFACFTGPKTIVVGRCDASVDPENAAVLDRNAARLAAIRTPGGRLKVLRLPMPERPDGVWRSFTNVIFANGTLLVPIYTDVAAAAGDEALALYGRLLPGWKIVGVDARSMAKHQGGLRCVSLYVPERP